ncbi:MAG: hypothetical protein HC825_11380, partial [Oscillatoriales cyanobacterium RM1_1_9]|nr:hypothetical protein [Oscillatoriales cyanobacterium RM1_1_9]
INSSKSIAGNISQTDLQLVLRSTGEVLAIVQDITAADFEPIKRIEPLII